MLFKPPKIFKNYFVGFHSVCASNALIMLRPEEVEQLVCGCPTLDLGELRKVTFYDGYKQDDKTIQHFWEVSLTKRSPVRTNLADPFKQSQFELTP